MNRESLRASLPTLFAHAIPKNARRIHCSYFDDQPQRNAFGLRIDPQPAEGLVIALTDEAFIVKTDRTSFVAVDRVLATESPDIGDKVRVTPYIRRDFVGERLDAPKRESRQTPDGQAYAVTTVTLGGNLLRIPLQVATRLKLVSQVEQSSNAL